MGLCLCKDRSSSSETTTCCGCTSLNCPCCFRWGKIRGGGSRDSAANGGGRVTSGHNRDTLGSDRTTSSAASDPNFLITHLSPPLVDSYVLETLKILRTLVGKYAHKHINQNLWFISSTNQAEFCWTFMHLNVFIFCGSDAEAPSSMVKVSVCN